MSDIEVADDAYRGTGEVIGQVGPIVIRDDGDNDWCATAVIEDDGRELDLYEYRRTYGDAALAEALGTAVVEDPPNTVAISRAKLENGVAYWLWRDDILQLQESAFLFEILEYDGPFARIQITGHGDADE